MLEKGTRIQGKVLPIILDDKEALDIDDYTDWAIAEYHKTRMTFVIRVDGSKELGYGHLYRAISYARCLIPTR